MRAVPMRWWRAARWCAAVTALALAGASEAADGRLVDTVLAEIESRPVMLSDVALARALGVLGLTPAPGPITDADLGRYLDAQLAVREASQLAIEVSPADVDRAWELSGGAALAERLAAVGIEPAWARRLLEADLLVARFVDLRFRDFAFVTDFDVDAALGPGSHDGATRARTRDRLRAEMVERAYTAWKDDARQRFPIRRIPGANGPWPAPFALGDSAAKP
jgi:hypothetical protein